MEARVLRLALICVSLFVSTGADYQSANFKVSAPDAKTALLVARAAENYRRDLAVYWLGQPLPNWSRPCRLRVKVGPLGASGETKFQFIGREVINWDMVVQGSLERILDSVLPHEVNHTIFACHFRRPLPRWADEGAATLFEHRSEQAKQLHLLENVIQSGRGFIQLERLLEMKEYPRDYRAMLTLYAEGYALADFLVQQGGRDRYLKFLSDGHRMGWTQAIKANYAHNGISELQKNWRGWILAGMPKLSDPREEMLTARQIIARNALQQHAKPTAVSDIRKDSTVRLQSPQSGSGRPDSTIRLRENRTRNPRPPTSGSSVRTAATNGRSTLANSGRSAASRKREDELRSASFEAPQPGRTDPAPTGDIDRDFVPRAGTSRPTSSTSNKQPSPERNSRGPFQRSKLPQERTGQSGSLPQWAGFPG